MSSLARVGDIVHYTTAGCTVVPAIVIALRPDAKVVLKCFTIDGDLVRTSVAYTHAHAGSVTAEGCWSWIDR